MAGDKNKTRISIFLNTFLSNPCIKNYVLVPQLDVIIFLIKEFNQINEPINS